MGVTCPPFFKIFATSSQLYSISIHNFDISLARQLVASIQLMARLLFFFKLVIKVLS